MLPILTVDSLDDAIDFVNKGEKPLAMYVFTESRATFERVSKLTSAGGVTHNDTLLHAGGEECVWVVCKHWKLGCAVPTATMLQTENHVHCHCYCMYASKCRVYTCTVAVGSSCVEVKSVCYTQSHTSSDVHVHYICNSCTMDIKGVLDLYYRG